jgi:hypothetical protein
VSDRPEIPAELKRRLLVESGHRCALPTCRQVAPLEIEHIDDWSKVRRHDFENMIVLCANCHGRKGNGPGQIDRKSLRQYKANLAIINSRYSDVERRALEVLAQHRAAVARAAQSMPPQPASNFARGVSIALPGSLRLMMMYLVQDGYVEIAPPGTRYLVMLNGSTIEVDAPLAVNGPIPDTDYYRLTPTGVEFLDSWIAAKPLEHTPS